MPRFKGPPPLPGKIRGGPNVIQFVLLSFGILILAAIVWYAMGRLKDRAAVKRLEADIKRKGEPLTLVELAAQHLPIADSQNAAIPLLELWKKDDPAFWTSFENNERPLPPRKVPSYDPDLPYLGRKHGQLKVGEKLTLEMRRAAQLFVQSNEVHYVAIRSALRRTNAHFPIQIEDGLDALLPHLSELKSEAQKLRIVALAAADSGDQEEAIAAAEDIVRLSGLLADEPLLISQLVRIACLQMAIGIAEDILSRNSLSTNQFHRLEMMLSPIDNRKMLHHSLISERVENLSLFTMSGKALARVVASDGEEPSDPGRYESGMKVLSALGVTIGDRRLILETLQRSLVLAEKDYPEMFVGQRQLSDELQRQFRTFPPKVFARLLLGSSVRIMDRFISLEARKRSALVALQVERYRLEHAGMLPKKLEGQIPSVLSNSLRDPFNGEVLRFRPLTNGYVVYSVGADLRDDGGINRPRAGKGKNPDEGFLVLRMSETRD